jgi:hypothetical protein
MLRIPNVLIAKPFTWSNKLNLDSRFWLRSKNFIKSVQSLCAVSLDCYDTPSAGERFTLFIVDFVAPESYLI